MALTQHQKNFANLLAKYGLLFGNGLILKDGRPTPYFVNIGKFNTGKLNFELGTSYTDMIMDTTVGSRKLIDLIDVVYGPSYKGSAIANGIVNALWVEYKIDKGFEYDRKEAKTHGEASGQESLLVNGSLFDGCKIFMADDVLTSGVTKYDAIEKITKEAERLKYKVEIVGLGIAVDREQTTPVYDSNKDEKLPKKDRVILDQRGNDAIDEFVKETRIPVYSVIGITGCVDYLYEKKIPVLIDGKKQPISDQLKANFDEYIRIYGTSKAAMSRGKG